MEIVELAEIQKGIQGNQTPHFKRCAESALSLPGIRGPQAFDGTPSPLLSNSVTERTPTLDLVKTAITGNYRTKDC